jgi:hypothetical protein
MPLRNALGCLCLAAAVLLSVYLMYPLAALDGMIIICAYAA